MLFDLLSTASERQKPIVTTNLAFERRTDVLGSERLAGAALDRLARRCHFPHPKDDSCRLRDTRRRAVTSDWPVLYTPSLRPLAASEWIPVSPSDRLSTAHCKTIRWAFTDSRESFPCCDRSRRTSSRKASWKSGKLAGGPLSQRRPGRAQELSNRKMLMGTGQEPCIQE